MAGPRVSILGAGNVASRLAPALAEAGAHIVQVWGPTASRAESLAESVGAAAVTSPAELSADSDFYILAVRDTAVASTAAAMPRTGGIVVHTSGSVPMEALAPASSRTGVLYPLQTFTTGRRTDLSHVPFFTEGSDADTLAAIDALAGMLTDSVHHADSSTRPLLHVAGVLGCNFPNFLLGCAADVLARGGYSLDVLRPLLEETVAKAFEAGPDAAQTGPAARGDVATIERHCGMLPPEQARIYRDISELIMVKHS
ncbi:MAG: DUF2520 domain-containing protein [Muribaculaceae bacterium]|nr:DUF2520 domain-containing protein [Muribaculaceae bacterium]